MRNVEDKQDENATITRPNNAFAHIPKEDRRKLDTKAIKCIFIGHCTDKKEYKRYNPNNHKVFSSIDVIFHEHADKQIKEGDYVWHATYEKFKEEDEVVESSQAQESMEIPKENSRSESSQRSDESTPQRRRRA